MASLREFWRGAFLLGKREDGFTIYDLRSFVEYRFLRFTGISNNRTRNKEF